jgi:hypothetical protein
MSERVSIGGAGQWPGVSGGGIGRAGYAKGHGRPARSPGTRAAGMAPRGSGSQTSAAGCLGSCRLPERSG